MKLRGFAGELLLCAVFIATGLFWVAVAAGMPLWEGFAPATGFLPLLYGVLLALLAIAATVADVLGRGEGGEAKASVRRPAIVLLALAAAVAGIETAGFFASMALAMLFLFRVAERLPVVGSVVIATGVSAGLTLVFRTWLGVPLPAGPWGF